MLWGELRQLLLLQRVKDERTRDLKMRQKDTKHTHKKKTQKSRERHEGRGQDKRRVGEKSGRDREKMHTGTKAEGNGRVNNTIKQK